MVIFPDLSEGMVEQVQVADEITVTLRVASQVASTGVLFTYIRDCPLKCVGVPVNFPVKSS
jgi:hypothetical protein